MARYEVPIDLGEVPVINTLDDLQAATGVLALGNAAYIVGETIESTLGTIVTPERKINALVYGLNQVNREWVAGPPASRTVDASSDIGVHGNPYQPWRYTTSDYLHYHQTPRVDGQMVVTFANATPAYMDDQSNANRRLTDLLAQGRTDRRYADPASFRQATLGAGGTVLFRLNEGETGLPLLHSFQTIGGGSRDAEITPLYRLENSGVGTGDGLGQILSAILRSLGSIR
jgi:hypothetical protein